MPAEIIQFPAPVVRLVVEPIPPQPPRMRLLVVEHDGQNYSLASLLARLPNDILDELDALVPRSAQETWDLIFRRWPRVAKAAVGSIVSR